ncbi:hypothetical protein ACE1SV_70920 [Streptomyces sp. E-15]
MIPRRRVRWSSTAAAAVSRCPAWWTRTSTPTRRPGAAPGCRAAGRGTIAEFAARVVARTGVPVVGGVAAAVGIAESLVRQGLTTSKVRTYAPPRPKLIANWPPGDR